MRTDSLVIFLIDVETVRQTGEKGFHDHIVHSESSFQAPEDREENWSVKALHMLLCVLYKRLSLWVNSPADVIYGDVPQLLIHGGLAPLARMCTYGGLGVLVGNVDLYLTTTLKKKKIKLD